MFYCILGLGVHVKNMQDCCIGTYMAMWFATSIPITYIWHFSPCYPSPTPIQHPSPSPSQQTAVWCSPPCVQYVLIVQHPPMSENMQCFIFCSCVSLLKMMVSRFSQVPTKDTNSLFFMAAKYSMVYMCHIFPAHPLMGIWVGSRSLLL